MFAMGSPACQRATPNLYTEWGALSTGVLYLIVLVNSGQTMLHDWSSVNSDTYIHIYPHYILSVFPGFLFVWTTRSGDGRENIAIKQSGKPFSSMISLWSLYMYDDVLVHTLSPPILILLSLSLCQSLDCILFYSLSLQSSSQVFDELTINFKRQITWLRHWKTSSNCARIIRDRV
jgi:hypothetical protein